MSTEQAWTIFFELANEATVVAESIGDYTLAGLACDAATGAADRLGFSNERVIALRQDLRKRVGAAAPGTRLSAPRLTFANGEHPGRRKAGAGPSRSSAASKR
jgi:hypothetical protein